LRAVLGRLTVLRNPGRQALLGTLTLTIDRAGFWYEDPSLPGVMVDAVGLEPARLPLLQFAASELWDKRDEDRRLLPRSAYVAMAGVEGALARHADGVLAGLTPQQLADAARLEAARLHGPAIHLRTASWLPRPSSATPA
jgi:hypothetical protein